MCWLAAWPQQYPVQWRLPSMLGVGADKNSDGFCSGPWFLCCCLHAGIRVQWMWACKAVLVPTCKSRCWKPLPNPVFADVSEDCRADIKESRFSENATLVFILLPCMKWHVGLLQGLVCCLCSSGKVFQTAGLPTADSMGDDVLCAGQSVEWCGVASQHCLDLMNQIIWKHFSRTYACALLLNPKVSAWSHVVHRLVSDLGSDAFSALIPFKHTSVWFVWTLDWVSLVNESGITAPLPYGLLYPICCTWMTFSASVIIIREDAFNFVISQKIV